MRGTEVRYGDRFGRLVVVAVAGSKAKNRMMHVRCDCGTEAVVSLGNMSRGRTQSCGCLSSEVTAARNFKHGASSTKEFNNWADMLNRCLNPNNKSFGRYSQLGVEQEWTEDFTAFLAHIGPLPNQMERWSIGRIDNDIGYYPGNVRWETPVEQNRNRSRHRNNTSGVAGVTWRDSDNRAVATWYELDGKQKSKSFPAKRVGRDEAIRQAAEYRAAVIERLNNNGAGYTPKHGELKLTDKINVAETMDKLGVDYR